MDIQEIIKNIKQIDKKIMRIVKNGLKFSLVCCLLAATILVAYITNGEPNSYYIGISLLKSGLYYIVGLIVFGIYFNRVSR